MKRWILFASFVLVLVGGLGALVAGREASADTTVTVAVGDLFFCSSSFENGVCETDINAGDTVRWDFSQATSQHTSTSDTSVWNSGTTEPGGTFQFRFTQPGTYLYHCNIHPEQMRGKIVVSVVLPAVTPTSPPAGTTSTPGAVATATPSSGGTLPTSGYGPQPGATSWWWLAALALGGSGLIAIGASALYRRARA